MWDEARAKEKADIYRVIAEAMERVREEVEARVR